MKEELDWLCRRPFAHRGLFNIDKGIPENSLVAFGAAITDGYCIELDVQSSADGEAIVFHDWDLFRMTGAEGHIGAYDACQLSHFQLQQSGQKIPTLVEVLKLVRGRSPLIVEIKSWGDQIGQTELSACKALQNYDGLFAITSFNTNSLSWFREAEPTWLRGQNLKLLGFFNALPFWKHFSGYRLLKLDKVEPDFYVCDSRNLPFWAAANVRNGGMPLLAYTVNNKNEMRRIQNYVDNIIFEGFHS